MNEQERTVMGRINRMQARLDEKPEPTLRGDILYIHERLNDLVDIENRLAMLTRIALLQLSFTISLVIWELIRG
jgi:hypothetical protein